MLSYFISNATKDNTCTFSSHIQTKRVKFVVTGGKMQEFAAMLKFTNSATAAKKSSPNNGVPKTQKWVT